MDENYNPDIVSVVDEDGVEHTFEELDRIETDDARYVALLPVYDEAEDILDDDGELIILKVNEEDGETYLEHDEEHYKLLVTRDNRLVGFIMIGDVDRAGIYTSLIREQTPLDSIDFDLIREKPQLMAFSRAERAKKLGGAH